jgi:putative endonuclease
MSLTSKNNDKARGLGKTGEEQAKIYLQKNNYIILETNWRYKKYEIDLITEISDKVVIVEVKTRNSNAFGNPENFVDIKKQRFLITAANAYAEKNNLLKEIRFDIISVLYSNNVFKIEHIKDAFYPII